MCPLSKPLVEGFLDFLSFNSSILDVTAFYPYAELRLLLQLDSLSVDLSKNNLTGTLPSSWAGLSKASCASKKQSCTCR